MVRLFDNKRKTCSCFSVRVTSAEIRAKIENPYSYQKLNYTIKLSTLIKGCGTRAIGNYRNGSDIDLTLTNSDEQPKQTSITDISAALDELDLPYTFDLSHYEKITNLDLCEHIDRVGIIFYQKY